MADQNLTKKHLALYAAVAVLLVAYAFVLYRQEQNESIQSVYDDEGRTISEEAVSKIPKPFRYMLIRGQDPQVMDVGTSEENSGIVTYVVYKTTTGIGDLEGYYRDYFEKTGWKVLDQQGSGSSWFSISADKPFNKAEVDINATETGSDVAVRWWRPYDSP